MGCVIEGVLKELPFCFDADNFGNTNKPVLNNSETIYINLDTAIVVFTANIWDSYEGMRKSTMKQPDVIHALQFEKPSIVLGISSYDHTKSGDWTFSPENPEKGAIQQYKTGRELSPKETIVLGSL
ncbi:hypothetical protein QYF36_018015 [Acer negundo]|nr:hypothetical protein QYF36_018015 [Acer negundo]